MRGSMNGDSPLASLLLDASPDAGGASPAEVESTLAGLALAGATQWPAIPLSPVDLVRHIARHRPAGEPVIPWLRGLRAGDLHLACACGLAAPGAIAAFDREILGPLAGWLARLRPSATFVDEVRQSLHEKLFVAAPGRPAKIGEYAGQGALASWTRVSAVRLAIDLQRHENVIPVVAEDPAGIEAPPDGAAAADPERSWMQSRYRAAFEKAFRAAVADLKSEQRNLLTLHFVDGLTLEQVATLFRVHRATAARWIAAARDAIFDETRRLVRAELGISEAEFESIAGLVRSRLDLSIVGLLKESRD